MTVRGISWPRFVLSSLLVLGPVSLAAQTTGTPASTFVIDQGAPDLATANGYVYRYYADGSATGIVIPMTCTGTASPFVCTGKIPAFIPGSHSVTLTAANAAGESAKSAPLTFIFVVVPSAPQNPRLG